jgi:hypothetical protein
MAYRGNIFELHSLFAALLRRWDAPYASLRGDAPGFSGKVGAPRGLDPPPVHRLREMAVGEAREIVGANADAAGPCRGP